jgi:hypothetical protein
VNKNKRTVWAKIIGLDRTKHRFAIDRGFLHDEFLKPKQRILIYRLGAKGTYNEDFEKIIAKGEISDVGFHNSTFNFIEQYSKIEDGDLVKPY